MTLIDDEHPVSVAVTPPAAAVVPSAVPALQQWGNSAPLALAAFAMTTFLLSMINAGLVDKGIEPVVFAMALMVGGGTQLIAGIIQLRSGKTFAGVLFSGFGAFWLSFWAITQFYLAEVPKAQVGHALGMYVFAWGAFIAWLWVASFRTNLVVNLALLDLIATFLVLGIGYYAGVSGLVTAAGYLGLIAAAGAAYLSCAELCEDAYGRQVLPVGSLAKH
jgi:succinate-acetate transporter protein